jgi:glycolate oxidase iron-sulfur subunit
VLAAEGCEVLIPAAQPCCGALPMHVGEEGQALRLARQMIDLFEKAQVDAVIINAAGCGSNVKEYGHLLRDDVEYAARAKAFAAKCRDISEFPGRIGATCHAPSFAPAGGLPRRLSLAARPRRPDPAPHATKTNPRARIAGNPRKRNLLWLRGNLQSGATGCRG